MELRPRSGVSGFPVKPRATSLDQKSADMNKVDDVANETFVNPPLSATGATRGGKSPSSILPAEGGRIRTSIPLPRSESAGGADRSPEGNPPRRRGQTRKGGDAGGRATPDQQPLAVAAIVGDSSVHPDEGVEFTIVTGHEKLNLNNAPQYTCVLSYTGDHKLHFQNRNCVIDLMETISDIAVKPLSSKHICKHISSDFSTNSAGFDPLNEN